MYKTIIEKYWPILYALGIIFKFLFLSYWNILWLFLISFSFWLYFSLFPLQTRWYLRLQGSYISSQKALHFTASEFEFIIESTEESDSNVYSFTHDFLQHFSIKNDNEKLIQNDSCVGEQGHLGESERKGEG